MTIGPDYVFLAVPRTASKSISKWLEHYGGVEPEDCYYHRADVPQEHAHKFTFAVVRNPYDRWMSLYHLIRQGKPWEHMKPDEFVLWSQSISERWNDPSRLNWDTWYWPQDAFLSHARIDRIVRFEALEEVHSLPFAATRVELPHINADRFPLNGMDASFIAAVNQVSGGEFERFGYKMLPECMPL